MSTYGHEFGGVAVRGVELQRKMAFLFGFWRSIEQGPHVQQTA